MTQKPVIRGKFCILLKGNISQLELPTLWLSFLLSLWPKVKSKHVFYKPVLLEWSQCFSHSSAHMISHLEKPQYAVNASILKCLKKKKI